MSTVRCKVRLNHVTKREHCQWVNGATHKQEVFDAAFSFVTAGDGQGASEENKRFWDATPTGAFSVGTTKEMPWEVGKEYYLDISPAGT